MSRVVILDTGPLGLLTNPKKMPETIAATRWAIDLLAAGHRLVVPAIADYEVRRELERRGKPRSITALDATAAPATDGADGGLGPASVELTNASLYARCMRCPVCE